jgi:D-amino-acid dehydrogenase
MSSRPSRPSRPGKPDVLVVGAGVIGMSCALELSRRGARVTVIDRGEVGHGCSYGNAGWLSPCLATPLPAPGLVRQALRWLFDPESPLYIQPRLSVVGWLLRFLAATSVTRFRAGTAALTALSRASLEAYARLAAEENGFGFRRDGLIVACETAAGLAAARHELALARDHGLDGEVLEADAARACEPALTGPLAGGVHYPGEAIAEPLAVVETLARLAARAGAEVRAGVEVFDFEVTGDRIRTLHTTRGPLVADVVLLATGSWSRRVARRLGLRIPVLGGKGYAVIVPRFDPAPRLPVLLHERHVAVTPRDGSVRFAGTLELVVDDDLSVSPRRVGAILRGARHMFRLPPEAPLLEVWRGLRPCTPDGLPVIGFADSPRNLFLATGHQMLGLHTAPATGRLAAELILGETPSFDPAPFRAGRF